MHPTVSVKSPKGATAQNEAPLRKHGWVEDSVEYYS